MKGKSEVEEKLAEVQRLMKELELQPQDDGIGIHRLSDELEMKSPVFYAVITSGQQSLDTVKVLNETWAGNIPPTDIAFFVEGLEGEVDDQLGIHELKSLPKNVKQLISSNLAEVQVLNYICQHKMNSTKWFFIANGDIYVKTHSLESYLMEVDALQYHHGYLGKPVKRDPIGRVCMPGPGSILSYRTMQEVCPKLEQCEKLHSEYVLGECIRHQLPRLQCNKEGHPHDLFLKFDVAKRGPITEQKHRDILDKALTVYPVSDPKLMYVIHQLIVAERLNDSQYQLQELKSSLDWMVDLLPQTNVHVHKDKEDAANTRDDVLSWKLINNNKLMSDEENAPTMKIPSVWKNEFNLLIKKAMDYLSTWEEEGYNFRRIVNGYYRVNPQADIDYIIDFEGKEVGSEGNFSLPAKHFRVALSRRFDSLEVNPVLLKAAGVESKHVTIAVFMNTNHAELFQSFMAKLENVLKHDQRVDLVVVKMKSKERARKEVTSVMDPKSILNLYRTKYPLASFTVVESPSLLSRDHGISLVIRDLRPNDIVFLADLDLEFDSAFMERCRSIPLQGQQAYFPILFSKVDPSLLKDMEHVMMEDTTSEHSGHWIPQSNRVTCLYAADILAAVQQTGVKGIPNSIDVSEVYRTLIEKGYEVIRTTDKGLRQLYDGARRCESELVGEEEDCSIDNGDYPNLYTRTQLSILLFDHEGADKF